jgi:hypothetical protein
MNSVGIQTRIPIRPAGLHRKGKSMRVRTKLAIIIGMAPAFWPRHCLVAGGVHVPVEKGANPAGKAAPPSRLGWSPHKAPRTPHV